jgi:hypothetical protein
MISVTVAPEVVETKAMQPTSIIAWQADTPAREILVWRILSPIKSLQAQQVAH